MPVQIDSTTDSAETVTAALGEPVKKTEVVETKSASPEPKAVETVEATADETSEESETSEETTEDSGKQKLSGVQKRIDKLTKRAHEKEREAEYWRQEALKTQKPADQNPKPAPSTKVEGKPKQDDFETHDAYVEALTDWKVAEARKADKAEAQVTAQKSEYQKTVAGYQAKAQEFAKTQTDFNEVMLGAGDIPMSITVHNAILKAGPELAYEIAKDHDECARINNLPYEEAIEEIALIKSRLKPKHESSPKQETKTTKAPKPLTSVSAKGSGVAKTIFDKDISQREYEKLRMEQERQRDSG